LELFHRNTSKDSLDEPFTDANLSQPKNLSFFKTPGGIPMAGLNPHELTQPIYVRLPVQVSEEIRKQAMAQERTLSSQIRFLVLKALRMDEEIEEAKD